MSVSEIKSALPAYAKDLKLNLSSVLDAPGLTPMQIWGCAVATAVASRNPQLREAILADAQEHLSEEEIAAAKASAAIMGMNNIYYRYVHFVADDEYAKLPARLRMSVIGKPGVDKVTFELWSLAVSAINGCQSCVASHESVVRQGGLSKQAVQSAVRIASVMHGVAVALEAG